jgi:hypothetical protein
MSDSVLTLKQLETIFQTITLLMLGYEATDENANFVRIAWMTSGQPAFKIGENIAFVRCIETDDVINRAREVELEYQESPEGFVARMSSVRVINCQWNFYGSNSWDNAQMVRDKLFFTKYHDILALKDIYMVLDIKAPVRMPESIQGSWWERVDLNADFNNGVIREDTENVINSVDINFDNGNIEAEILLETGLSTLETEDGGVTIEDGQPLEIPIGNIITRLK